MWRNFPSKEMRTIFFLLQNPCCFVVVCWRWQPHIDACRLLWSLLRAKMAVLTQFFAKCIFYIHREAAKKNWTAFFLLQFYSLKELFFFFVGGPELPSLPELRLCRQSNLISVKVRHSALRQN